MAESDMRGSRCEAPYENLSAKTVQSYIQDCSAIIQQKVTRPAGVKGSTIGLSY